MEVRVGSHELDCFTNGLSTTLPVLGSSALCRQKVSDEDASKAVPGGAETGDGLRSGPKRCVLQHSQNDETKRLGGKELAPMVPTFVISIMSIIHSPFAYLALLSDSFCDCSAGMSRHLLRPLCGCATATSS